MQREEKNSGFLYWTPAAIGAGVAGRRAFQDVKTHNINPQRWFRDSGAAGRAARDEALSSQTARGIHRAADHHSLVNDMFLKGTWKNGLNNEEARRAVAEATRSSLLRSNLMPMGEIQSLSSKIMNATSIPIEEVMASVQQFGNPKVFHSIMQNYNVQGFTPGTFFSPQEIRGMYEGALNKGMSVRKILPSTDWSRSRLFTDWWKNDLNTGEQARLQRMLGTLRGGEGGVGAAVTGISQYPGDIKMAQVSLIKKGMPNININLPLHETIYRRPGSAFVMSKMYKGLPSAGGKVMDFGDYYAGEIKDRLLPDVRQILATQEDKKVARTMIRQKFRAFEEDLSQYLFNTRVSAHPGQDLLNGINSQVLGVPDLSTAMGYKGPGAVQPNIEAEMGILFQQGKFPGLSSKAIMGGKIWGGLDPREMWAYGKNFPFEERPFQMLREFAPTAQALQLMKSSRIGLPGLSRTTPFLSTPLTKSMSKMGLISPQMVVGYALPGGRAEEALKATGLAEQELLIRKSMMGMYATSRLSEVNISLNEAVGHGSALANWIKESATTKINKPFNLVPGERIGYELSTGEAVSALNSSGVTQKITGAEFLPKTNAVKLSIQESFLPEDYVKLFGSMKVTTKARDDFYMSKVLKRIGLRGFEDQALDSLTFLNKIKKNRTFLQQQMSSALGVLASQRVQELQSMGRSPGIVSEMKRFLTLGGQGIEKMLPDEMAILHQATKWNLDLRLIGGAMPFAKDILPQGVLEQATALAGPAGLVHPSGMVLGLAAPRVGAYRSTAGGGVVERGIMGSMEPRGFQQLLQHKWMNGETNVAELIAGDLASHMESYGSDLSEVINMARSVGGHKVEGLDVVNAWQQPGFELAKKPYMLDLGVGVKSLQGANQIYVPAAETMRRFGVFRTPEGELMQTELMRAYGNIHRTAVAARNVSNSTEAISNLNTAGEALNRAIMTEAGMAMFGRGGGVGVAGALRGRVQGSQFLPLSATDLMAQEAVENTVELSEKAGGEMYNELLKSASTQEAKEFLIDQRRAFMKGSSVPGTISRHPFTGPYSIQPSFIRKSALDTSRTENFATVPARRMEEVTAGLLGKLDVNVSPVWGFAGDFDDDHVIVSLIGNQKVAKATEDLLKGGTYTQEYKRFAAETTALKELTKRQLGSQSAFDKTDIQQMVTSSSKLRVSAAETGNISSALSEAKLAMSHYKPEQASRFNIIAEMLEQQIISGKHMKDVESQNIAKETAGALRSIQKGESVGTLENITRNMFGPELERGIDIRSSMGNWTMKTDIHQMWSSVQDALVMGREKGGIISRYSQMARGRVKQGPMAVNEVLAMLETARVGKMDNLFNLAARGIAKEPGFMHNAVADTMRGINQGIKEVGLRARSWGKPLIWGLAATAAASMLLGGPKMQPLSMPSMARNVNPNVNQDNSMLNSSLMNRVNSKPRDLRPENMPMPSFQGNPGTPHMVTPTTYLAGPEQRFQVKARADTKYSPDHSSINQSLSPFMHGNNRVTFNDNRRKMTSQDISSMLEGF